MGRASRWLKALFAFKKDKNRETLNPALCHNPATIPPNISPIEAAWLRSYYIGKEQSKHAIAVAAATAAAADAAILAAHAAVAVVKLTCQNGQGNSVLESCRARCAAVRIQSAFRGYLARKALRALKGLVKLQALVRGFLVRKQAAATLHSMQALFRAQATVRSRRVRSFSNKDSRFSGEFVFRKSVDNSETRSVCSRRFSSTFETMLEERPKIVEMDTSSRPKSRSRRNNLSISESINDWGLTGEECKFSTAQSTPRFYANSATAAVEPMLNPSYMANTQSFRAKVRSYSAPRQRPDVGKRRVSLLEMMEARNSLSGVKMQTSCSSAVSFKNAVMGKLELSREERCDRRNANSNSHKNVTRR
ncbi:unnamed protein product [Rhodiola kirilowii]